MSGTRSVFIGKGLVKLILGFFLVLASKWKQRRGMKLSKVFLTLLSMRQQNQTGGIITKKSNRMIRWDRESSKFFTEKMDWCSGSKSMIKYATYFSEAICVSVLCENDDHVLALSELIKLAFLLKFEEEAVDFLMESNDLQIFLEEYEFLSSAFPVD